MREVYDVCEATPTQSDRRVREVSHTREVTPTQPDRKVREVSHTPEVIHLSLSSSPAGIAPLPMTSQPLGPNATTREPTPRPTRHDNPPRRTELSSLQRHRTTAPRSRRTPVLRLSRVDDCDRSRSPIRKDTNASKAGEASARKRVPVRAPSPNPPSRTPRTMAPPKLSSADKAAAATKALVAAIAPIPAAKAASAPTKASAPAADKLPSGTASKQSSDRLVCTLPVPMPQWVENKQPKAPLSKEPTANYKIPKNKKGKRWDPNHRVDFGAPSDDSMSDSSSNDSSPERGKPKKADEKKPPPPKSTTSKPVARAPLPDEHLLDVDEDDLLQIATTDEEMSALMASIKDDDPPLKSSLKRPENTVKLSGTPKQKGTVSFDKSQPSTSGESAQARITQA